MYTSQGDKEPVYLNHDAESCTYHFVWLLAAACPPQALSCKTIGEKTSHSIWDNLVPYNYDWINRNLHFTHSPSPLTLPLHSLSFSTHSPLFTLPLHSLSTPSPLTRPLHSLSLSTHSPSPLTLPLHSLSISLSRLESERVWPNWSAKGQLMVSE